MKITLIAQLFLHIFSLQESPSPSPSLDTPSQDAIALKKALEWELALDSRDLRSHAWYHGPIPRQRADEFLRNDGEFLVRDCVSQPGNYVLSCRAKGQTLHFVINKVGVYSCCIVLCKFTFPFFEILLILLE